MIHFSSLRLTKFKGYYIDFRDNVRIGVTFTYNIVDVK